MNETHIKHTFSLSLRLKTGKLAGIIMHVTNISSLSLPTYLKTVKDCVTTDRT